MHELECAEANLSCHSRAWAQKGESQINGSGFQFAFGKTYSPGAYTSEADRKTDSL